MFSTDRSKQIAAAYPNVRWHERDGYIYGNFNYGVASATSQWIIRLDSDEVLSTELQQSIVEILNSPSDRCQSYDALCHLYFFGKRLTHGFGNSWRTTLFRKGAARYQAKSEHEHLTVDGPVGRLSGHYDHFTNPTISAWIAKTNYYTDRDIERMPEPVVALPRWKITYQVLRLFQRLYLRPGWMCKDGYLGFVVSGLGAYGLFIQHCKAWERAENSNAPLVPMTKETLGS